MMLRTLHRSLLAICALLVVPSLAAPAQGVTDILPVKSPYGDRLSTAGLTIGLGGALGGSSFLDPAENWKVSPITSTRIGADISYPLTPVIGASLGLGIESRGGKSTWYQSTEIWDTRRISYFTISPGFNFSALSLGLNIGIPLGGTRTWHNGAEDRTYSQDIDAGDDELTVMLEPRIGAVIPLIDQEVGWLGLTVGAGYNLSDVSENRSFLPGEDPQKRYSTQTASVHLGLTWQFAIPGTSRR